MEENLKKDRLFQGICLLAGQLLLSVSSFFWDDSGRYTINGGVLIILAMVFWTIGFMGLFDLIKEKNPWYSRIGLLYAIYGCLGGIAFGFEGLFSTIINTSDKIGVSAHEKFPLQMDLVMFWSGPAFPLSLVILGIVLMVRKIGYAWINLLLVLGGIAFPLSRISRMEWIAHIADILLLMPLVVISSYFIKGQPMNDKRFKL